MKIDLQNQKNVFQQVKWSKIEEPSFLDNISGQTVIREIRGMPGYYPHPSTPYFEFDLKADQSGICIQNLVAKDTQSPGSVEPVVKQIEFTDIEITFDDNSIQQFDVVKAVSSKNFKYKEAVSGVINTLAAPNDDLYQRGIALRLWNDFPGNCRIVVELSFVTKGPNNDIDPGRIPLAMKFFPQISFLWFKEATKRVKNFRGTIKLTINNQMSHGHHGTGAHLTENIASFFSDGNFINNSTIETDGRKKDVRAKVAPYGWAAIFDYTKTFVQAEYEFDAVYSPPPQLRTGSLGKLYTYEWPTGQSGLGVPTNIGMIKDGREGFYDNIHIHGRMSGTTINGDEIVHAPFCVHSCVHIHWRWGNLSSEGAVNGLGWKFKGWSNAEPHVFAGSPLIPPNQGLRIALTHPGTKRFDRSKVIDTSTSKNLDASLKTVWYSIDIHDPNSGEWQVLMEHGCGWAYSIAFYADLVKALVAGWHFNPPPLISFVKKDKDGFSFYVGDEYDTIISMTWSDFFQKLYDDFRYFKNGSYHEQVPHGDYTEGGTKPKMEEV